MLSLAELARLGPAMLVLLLATCEASAQQDEQSLRNRFLKGVNQAAGKLDELSFRAKCRRTSQLTSVSAELKASYAERGTDPKKLDVHEFDCAIRGPFSLRSGLNSTGLQYFHVRNGTYAFAILQTPGRPHPSLEYVTQLGTDPAIDSEVAEREIWVRGSALAAFYLWGLPLSRIVESADFQIQRVSASPSDNGELVRVEYSHIVRDANNEPATEYSDCYLVADPAQEWALVEYGGTYYVHVNDGLGVRRAVLELGDSVDGMPIATRVEWIGHSPNDPGTTSQMISIIEVTANDVPEEEFSLSHYGLAEPNFELGWSGSWLVYLIGGTACLAVAYAWRRRRMAVA